MSGKTPSQRRREQRKAAFGRGVRLRVSAKLPKPAEHVEVPYAKRYEHGFDAGEAVAWLIGRDEWRSTIGVMCELVEAARPKKGPIPSYTTWELETALFYQVMLGIRTWRATRNKLAGDDGVRSRVALGFDVPRAVPKCIEDKLTRLRGVPSESTMSRHRDRAPWSFRLPYYRAYFDKLRILNAQDPELREGLRILGIDGTAQPSSLTCPVIDKETGEVLNATRVTFPEGGYRKKRKEYVHGSACAPLHCNNSLPWAYAHDRVNASEPELALRALEDFRDKVLPHIGPRRLGVLTADSGFDHNELRRTIQELGYVPNISGVSHAKGTSSSEVDYANAARLRHRIEERPGWFVDGFRELHHECGEPVHTFRRFDENGGRAVVRLDAHCEACDAHISITSGQYKLVRDGQRRKSDPRGLDKYTKVQPGDPDSVRRWDFGNPLTYHDEVSTAYGEDRFGHGEGFNGAAVKRFKLFKTKAYIEEAAQAELHCLMVFCAMHGLTQRRRELEAAGEFRHIDQRPRRKSFKKNRSPRAAALAA